MTTECLIYRSGATTRLRTDRQVQHPTKPDQSLATVRLPRTQLFDVGTHNGTKFSHEDIRRIVEDSNEVHQWLKPVVKLGHDSPLNELGDGMPGFGRLGKFAMDGTKVAVEGISGVPITLATIIALGGYERVSIEMYRNWKAPNGKRYPFVIYAVAFLGAQMPAVKTLDDIPKLYEASDDLSGVSEVFHGEWSVAFADQPAETLEETMSEEKKDGGATVAVEVYNQTRDKAEKAEKDAAEARDLAKKAEAEAKEYRDKLEKQENERKAAEAQRVEDAARSMARSFCDEFKTRLKPAHRPAVEAALFALATGTEPGQAVEVAVTFKEDGTPNERREVKPLDDLKVALKAIFGDLPEMKPTDQARSEFDDTTPSDSMEAGRKVAEDLLTKHGYKKPAAA